MKNIWYVTHNNTVQESPDYLMYSANTCDDNVPHYQYIKYYLTVHVLQAKQINELYVSIYYISYSDIV